MSSASAAVRTDADARPSTDRIGALDILRGIALLGMLLVHVNDQAIPTADADTSVSAIYQRFVPLLFEERFWAMFGILFGVGFAVQFRRAEARRRAFIPMYLRRLGALAALGAFAHAVLGYHVLLEYAIWGVALLLVRRVSTRSLVIALLVSAMSWSMYSVARTAYGIAAMGETSYRSAVNADVAANRSFRQANQEARHAANYGTVFVAQLQHMAWFYAQPYSFLPVNTFTLFLIGVIGLRLGMFDEPAKHQRAILMAMGFGLASWAAATWLLPDPSFNDAGSPLLRQVTIAQLAHGFGVIRPMWLALTYIGGILLLIARNPAWQRRLGAFGWTGRMALTNYILQIAMLDLVFANFALGLKLSALQDLAAGLVLFAMCALASRWWLSLFRFGPLEWLWRSITYGRLQSLRAVHDTTNHHGSPANRSSSA